MSTDRNLAGFAVAFKPVHSKSLWLAKEQLAAAIADSLRDLPPISYTDEGLSLFSAALENTLRKAAGVLAPKRRRPRRVQKKIDKRHGRLHYGAVIRPLD